jgi:hypothetical protein
LILKHLDVTAREEKHMNLWSWIILLGASAVLASAAQYLFFRHDRKKTDYDWVYIAGGAYSHQLKN